jgi:hypothetical protein
MKKTKKKEAVANPDFKLLDKDEWTFGLPQPAPGTHLNVFKYRAPISAWTLFNSFLPKSLLKKIWDDRKANDPLAWSYGKSKPRTIGGGQFSYSLILCFLACQVRITGLQNKPKENEKNDHPLRGNYINAKSHFENMLKETAGDETNTGKFPGIAILELLSGRFQFVAEYFDSISKNFQAIVGKIGEYTAGDEKLLHFTGDSDNIRMILTKPDRVGHWFYELCIKLSNGLSYLLYLRAHLSDPARAISIKTSEIVKDWTSITTSLGGPGANPNAVTVFDSYYLDNTGRNHCIENKKKFIGAIQRSRFEPICQHLSGLCHEKGEWECAYNEKTNELLVKYFDPEHPAPKYVLSNAFIKRKKPLNAKKSKKKSKSVTVPVYSEYNHLYNLCDRFNRNLHERTWPHKTGGNGSMGEDGHYHNFALSSILQNIFNLYFDINAEDYSKVSFSKFCCDLADEIVRFAFNGVE